MSKERIHIMIESDLKKVIEEIAEIVTGSPKNYSQTINALMRDTDVPAVEHARKVKQSRQEAIKRAMSIEVGADIAGAV
jgi:ribosomal 50S subunit-associated protein YjgA (DUF615 family)